MDIRARIEEVRRIVVENGHPELAQMLTVERVLEGVRMMREEGVSWTIQDELEDFIFESWGEDN